MGGHGLDSCDSGQEQVADSSEHDNLRVCRGGNFLTVQGTISYAKWTLI